jgi:hypothetical protein
VIGTAGSGVSVSNAQLAIGQPSTVSGESWIKSVAGIVSPGIASSSSDQ